MTYARRKDTSHKAIAQGLVQAGFSVADTSRLGDDFPDLVIGKHGFDAKVECKTAPNKVNKRRKAATASELMSEGQQDFAGQWKGSPVIAAYCLEDVLYGFNLLLRRHGWGK